ncbi:NF038129 family PEP-CTERM protein [Rugamonas sp.]|uniref:NF038129 family PEP-CTERM protein n=1 Tax=Rugamonas sp. TaxID=1926287 RepID=UPI0025ECBCBA|nr:NF038129 family PEP-CTERM protein [Rugamonas sp.]
MFATTLSSTFRRTVLALALAAGASLAHAATLHVELDTSGFAGLVGGCWLDLTFAAGSGGNAVPAQAVLSLLSGFDAGQAAQIDGHVTGSLATGYTLDNSVPADLFQAVHFGGKVEFDVNVSGAIDPSLDSKAVFAATLYGADQMTLLGNSANGSLLQLIWTPAAVTGQQGSVAATVYDNSIATVAAVPEPSSWLMLGAGLALVGLMARRKQGAALAA